MPALFTIIRYFTGVQTGINPCPTERIYPTFANSVDPDQLASKEANWSGSALFAIKYMNLWQFQLKKAIDWILVVGVASWFIQQDKG